MLAGTPRPLSRLPTTRPPHSRNTHFPNEAHLTEKVENPRTRNPTGGKGGRIQHLPAGYDLCQTQDHQNYDANDQHNTTECAGSRPCRGQCIRPGAFPNLALVHTAEGIPQPSIIEVIFVPGTPRLRQGYLIISSGCTKTDVKDPRYQHTDYTKDNSKATASFPAGTQRPMPKIPFNHFGLHQGQYQGYRRKQTERPVSFHAQTDALAQRQLTRHHRLPSGSLDPYLRLTITNIQERVVTVWHAAQQALRATRGYARHELK